MHVTVITFSSPSVIVVFFFLKKARDQRFCFIITFFTGIMWFPTLAYCQASLSQIPGDIHWWRYLFQSLYIFMHMAQDVDNNMKILLNSHLSYVRTALVLGAE